jgi:anti-sigma factor RsiW
MVSCREFLLLFLDDWLAGELPPRRWRECDRHVERCRACAEYVASYRETVRLVRKSGDGEEPAELSEELVQAIVRHPRHLG